MPGRPHHTATQLAAPSSPWHPPCLRLAAYAKWARAGNAGSSLAYRDSNLPAFSLSVTTYHLYCLRRSSAAMRGPAPCFGPVSNRTLTTCVRIDLPRRAGRRLAITWRGGGAGGGVAKAVVCRYRRGSQQTNSSRTQKTRFACRRFQRKFKFKNEEN